LSVEDLESADYTYLDESKSRMARRKKSRRRGWKFALLIVLAFLLLLFLLRTPVLTAAGSFLVTVDDLERADIITVLMGATPSRVVKGVELYREGYGEYLVAVRSRDFDNYALLEELGLEPPGAVDINRNIALEMGLPEDSFVILEGRADSTWEEALALREFMQENELNSVIIVTSLYHSTRAQKTFQKVLGEGYTVLSRPSPYDHFEPQEWWKERRQALQLLLEYQKMLNYYLFQG